MPEVRDKCGRVYRTSNVPVVPRSGLDRRSRSPYFGRMEVELTADQRAFVRKAIQSGRISNEDEAVREALSLWERRERRRVEMLAALDEAEASLANGEGRPITDASMKALAEEVKDRGRRRLTDERDTAR